ncbi:hypothetical protein ScalyP_jg5671 [Parmales sp. scaly parma]|nr:hypothetical protein ScalyP_jg5671 [Parmales sp. scaly parma]
MHQNLLVVVWLLLVSSVMSFSFVTNNQTPIGSARKFKPTPFVEDKPPSVTTPLLNLLSAPTQNHEAIKKEIASLTKLDKGFDADVVTGDWTLVYAKPSKASPKSQSFAIPVNKIGGDLSNFDPPAMKFYNIKKTPRGNGRLHITDKYWPTKDAFTKSDDGKRVVLRRIFCDIVQADFKYWKLPRFPLPIRIKGGYLDFLYLDDQVRVTRGNLGGIFVHVREEVVASNFS